MAAWTKNEGFLLILAVPIARGAVSLEPGSGVRKATGTFYMGPPPLPSVAGTLPSQ